MTVIAMTREMGSLGKDVAAGLADQMGLTVVHHELVEHNLAERLGVQESAVHRYLEGGASLLERWKIDKEKLSRYTAEEILELAKQGNVVIRGWGAVAILRAVPHVLRVRVCAPMPSRERVMVERLGLMIPNAATSEILQNDAAHARIMRGFFGVNWEDPQLYHVVLNTGAVPVDACVSIVRLLAERPGSTVVWVVLSADAEREREARSSAADFLVDAAESTVIVKSFRESYFPYDGAQIKDFFEVVKQSIEPDLVLSHHINDEHQDHRIVAQLTWNTFRNHVVAEYEIPKYEGDLGHPNAYVPVSDEVAERKIELLLKHFGSQHRRSWFRSETFRGIMAIRGVECNAASGFAEGLHMRKLIM